MLRSIPSHILVLAVLSIVFPSHVHSQDIPYLQDFPTLPQGDQELEQLEPMVSRNEADEDRIVASALIAEARLLYQREDFAAALARYERAFRYSSAKKKIVKEILPIAVRLKRDDEAVRYVFQTDVDPDVDPFVIRRLAIHLSEQRRFPEALRLYEHVVAHSKVVLSSAVITQFEMGRLYFLVDDRKQAAESFYKVALALEDPKKYNLDHEDREALLQNADVAYGVMAESFLLDDRVDLAEKYFRLAHESDKNSPILAFNLARAAVRQKKYDSAKVQLEKYFDSKSRDAGTEPYALLFDIIRSQENDDQTARRKLIEQLNEIASSEKQNYMAKYFLAGQYLDTRQFAQAEKLIDQLMKEHPMLDGSKGLVQIYINDGKAEKLLQNLSDIYQNTGSLETVVTSIDLISTKPELANRIVDLAMERRSENSLPTNLTAAKIAMDAKRFDDVEKLYSFAVSQFPKPSDATDVLMSWGLDLLVADQNDRSKKVFQQVVSGKASDLKKAEAKFYLSGILAVEHQVEPAIETIREAIKLAPSIPQFQIRTGWIYYLNERYDDAQREYESFLATYADDYRDPGIRLLVSDSRMSLSNINVAKERVEEAVEWLELVLDEFPGDIGALNDLSYLWADEGLHLNRALEMAKIASDAEPDNVAYRDSYGWVLYKSGRIDDAIKELKKASDVEKPDGIILDHLGDAYLKSGDKESAEKAWKRALEVLPEESKESERTKIHDKLTALNSVEKRE